MVVGLTLFSCMRIIRKWFRCDTVEDCRRIRDGNLFLKRLSKWSSLFSVALSLLINEAVGVCIDRVFYQYNEATVQYAQAIEAFEKMRDQYGKATSSSFYRWTIGFIYPAPEIPVNGGLPPEVPKLDQRALWLYQLLNFVQLVLFLGAFAYCVRWIYADFRADGLSHLFARFFTAAICMNLVIYFGLRSLISGALAL